MAIDAGSAAINRSTSMANGYTMLLANNPVNATGTLDTVEVWAATNIVGLKVGTFYLVSGTTYRCRASANLGNVTAGAKRTFSGLSIAASAGDLLGAYWGGGTMERDNSGAGYYYVFAADLADPGDQASYTFVASRDLSLYASGTEAGTTSTTSSTTTTSTTTTTTSTSSTTSSTTTTASTSSTTSTTSTTATTASTSSTSSTTSTTSTTTSSSTSTTTTTTTYGGSTSLTCTTGLLDLTSQVTILEYENTGTDAMVCQILAEFGDGTNDLDGTGGDFELTLMFSSQTNEPEPQLIHFSTATKSSVFTEPFPLPVGATVTAKIKSPNAADTNVMVHTCIYEVGVESIRDELTEIIDRLARKVYVYGSPASGTIITR